MARAINPSMMAGNVATGKHVANCPKTRENWLALAG
jgi:hypothetical protein